MTEKTPGSIYLTNSNIPHKEFIHDGKVSSIEQAAEEREQEVNQIIRSILFRIEKEKFALILMAGKARVDWKKIRKHFKVSRLTTASPDEVSPNYWVCGWQCWTIWIKN